MPYTPSHIANFMLDQGDKEALPISQMKLLKLVYFAYGWNLAVAGTKLFEEPIEAWAHGPVVRSIYDEFKKFGKEPIEGRSVDFDLEEFDLAIPRVPSDDMTTQTVLQKVWDVYKHFSAWSLRNQTHEAGGPWAQVYKPNVWGIEITDDLMRPYFEKKIRQYVDASRPRAVQPIAAAS